MGLMYFPRYIKREGRDYFYLTLRHVLPGDPLGERSWQVKGWPQRGFPYAMASTTVGEGDDALQVLKLDPRMMSTRPEDAVTQNAVTQNAESQNAESQDAVDPDAVAPDGDAVAPDGVSDDDGVGNLVALIDPPPPAGALHVWHSHSAFALSAKPPVAVAVRLASGKPLPEVETARAALAVQQVEGMLVYIEATADVPSDRFREVFEQLGAGGALALAAPWRVALGGDTSVHGTGVRLPASSVEPVRLLRRAGPGPAKIFEGTKIVGINEWYPLQARRIRYFKKRKKTPEGS